MKSECQRNTCMPIFNTVLYNNQAMESTWVFISKWIEKMWWVQNGITFSHENKWIPVIWDNVARPFHIQWNKPDTESQISHVVTWPNTKIHDTEGLSPRFYSLEMTTVSIESLQEVFPAPGFLRVCRMQIPIMPASRPPALGLDRGTWERPDSCLLARGSRECSRASSLGHKQTQATETLAEPQAYVRMDEGRFRHFLEVLHWGWRDS